MHLGLIGYGNISAALMEFLALPDAPRVDQLTILVKPERLENTARELASHPAKIDLVEDCQSLVAAGPELVAECAGHECVRECVPMVLQAGIDVIVVSVGALSDRDIETSLRSDAAKAGARIILPAGAVGGIDLLSAIAAAGDVEVTYRGIKPPGAWAGTKAEEIIDLAAIKKASTFFEGTAREAASQFPKNANVAATLALAGAGFDATRVELIADPSASGNYHSYEVRSPVANYHMKIENLPSANNAKSSVSTIYSVLREIRNHAGPLVI